ncbi:ATP-grasp domain-containing protein [Campylobacter jejuni]|nr:ATP-grasp domain-containing protein [Campylobacter jejuni]
MAGVFNISPLNKRKIKMKTKHFFIIGGANLQIDLIKTANKYFITHIFDYDENCFCKNLGDYFHLISIDEKEKILELALRFNIIGIATSATELGNLTACYIGEKLGLGTNSYECAKNTTDKTLMKKIFKKYNIGHAKYILLRDEKDLEQIKEFPIVIKPSDRSAGRGVVKISSKKDLLTSYKIAKELSYNKIVLAEEILEGRQFSVETISSNGKHQIVAITEEYIREGKFADDFLEKQDLTPARLAYLEKISIETEIFKTLEAFDIKFGACHIEIKVKKINNNYETKIIEIATRIGGWRDALVLFSKNINFNELLIQTCLKQKLQKIENKTQNYCLLKIVFTKEDYEFYKKIKFYKKHLIMNELFFTDDEENFIEHSSSLMDAKGYYYLKIPFEENPDLYIKEQIKF